MRTGKLATHIPATSKGSPSENPDFRPRHLRKLPINALVFSCRFSTIRLRYTPASEPDFHVPPHAAPH
ncbi:hypothetical protein BLAT2472_90109 [Burkholderia latens]